MPYNAHYKFNIEFHLEVCSFFIPLLTAPELLRWSSLGSLWIFSQNLVVASLFLSGFIYLFTLLSPCSMSLGGIYKQSQGTHFPGGYR